MTNQTNPVDLSALGKIVVIVPQFTQWTGTRAMHEKDYSIGKDGSLPPKEVTRSLGLKAIIDTRRLRVFDRIKHRAEVVLENCGVKYLSGWAIPLDRSDDVFKELDALVAEYDSAKATFLAEYDQAVAEWARQHPTFEKEILDSKLPANDIAERITASYEPFRIQPVSDAKAAALAKTVHGLGRELLHSVSQAAATFFRESFLGKNRANKKTVNTVRRIRARLQGLAFLNGRIAPVVTLIDRVLSRMPTEGYFDGVAYWQLAALVKTLADESLLEEIITGRQTVDEWLRQIPGCENVDTSSTGDITAELDLFFEEDAGSAEKTAANMPSSTGSFSPSE